MPTLVKREKRLIGRLNRWQRESEQIYDLSAIPDVTSYEYVMAMSDICTEVQHDEAADVYSRYCPGYTDLFYGSVLLWRQLQSFHNEDGDCFLLPAENIFASHSETFGAASGVSELEVADHKLYFCDGGIRTAYFNPATRVLHALRFQFQYPSVDSAGIFYVQDGDTGTASDYLEIDSTNGLRFALRRVSGLTQSEILAL